MTLLELLEKCADHYAGHYMEPEHDGMNPALRAAATRLREEMDDAQRLAAYVDTGTTPLLRALTRINGGPTT